MAEKTSRRGRPSKQDLEERASRPQPLAAQPEGAKFRLLRHVDERADVEHYWARGAFYDALRMHAPAAYRELTQAALSSDPDAPTLFGQFLGGLNGTLRGWCSKYAFLVAGEAEPEEDRVPNWLSA